VAEVPTDHAKATERKAFFSNSYLNEPLVRNWPNGALLRWWEEAGGWIHGIFINLHFGVSHGSFFFSFFFNFVIPSNFPLIPSFLEILKFSKKHFKGKKKLKENIES
jgi:hypothetical protein